MEVYSRKETEYLVVNKTYKSTLMVEFSERHGGPFWYYLVQFTLRFFPDHDIIIEVERPKGKPMEAWTDRDETFHGKWGMTGDIGPYFFGTIYLGEKSFSFESLMGSRTTLILDYPSFWPKGEAILLYEVQ